MPAFAIVRSVQRYVGKLRIMRNEMRAERFMNSLPPEIRKDIGWPDRVDHVGFMAD